MMLAKGTGINRMQGIWGSVLNFRGPERPLRKFVQAYRVNFT